MKIILFGLRRSGTRLSFNIFRHLNFFRCYYEPLHPNLINSVSLCIDGKPRKEVFYEYTHIYNELKKYHEGFGAPKYDIAEEIFPNNLTELHFSYLDFLFESAENVLIQPVRSNYQIYQLLKRYPDARYVWVLRRPDGFVKSVLSYRKNLLDFHDACIPGNHAISNCKKNLIFRLMRGWDSFDNPWTQIGAANYIVLRRPYFRNFINAPTWIKLVALWYDHYMFVTDFIRENPDNTYILLYDKVCESQEYIIKLMDDLSLPISNINFENLIDKNILIRQKQTSIDTSDCEKMIQNEFKKFRIEIDLTYRQLLDY